MLTTAIHYVKHGPCYDIKDYEECPNSIASMKKFWIVVQRSCTTTILGCCFMSGCAEFQLIVWISHSVGWLRELVLVSYMLLCCLFIKIEKINKKNIRQWGIDNKYEVFIKTMLQSISFKNQQGKPYMLTFTIVWT